MGRDAVRQRRDGSAHLLERLHVEARRDRLALDVRGQQARPVGREPVLLVLLPGARRLEALLEDAHHAVGDGLALLGGDRALSDEFVLVLRQDRLLLGDRRVHHRLREHRLVELVVPVLAVAHDVNDDVALKLLPPHGRHLAAARDRLEVVAVDVEDRRLDRLGHVGAVGRRARRARVGGEADLVVDDDVDRAARRVVVKVGETHRLEDDALPREGRVAVQQDRHALVARVVAHVVLLRAHLAFDDRVDRLKVRRVGDERHVHRATGVGRARVRHAQVILDVARA
mmetsp:Transcript_51880/g.153010  ORF Transcript_51880/g.153010 Transcript_51880/m.153010 type:complete len:285 (-) Transcript_51880:92-946(-)